VFGNLAPQPIDRIGASERQQVSFKTLYKVFPCPIRGSTAQATSVGALKVGGADSISINQATEQESDQQAELELNNHTAALGSMLELDDAPHRPLNLLGQIVVSEEFRQSPQY
jgi:hypothetical protein